jgi:stalled ribosome rescue protein Dom34
MWRVALAAKKKLKQHTLKPEIVPRKFDMTTFHAVVWMDYQEAHVLMFDREHAEAQRIKSRSHHKHQGKPLDTPAFYAAIAKALVGTHEVLLTGPGLARNEFRDWCKQHQTGLHIIDSVVSDHPSDAQVVAMARQYFKKFDGMAGTAVTP